MAESMIETATVTNLFETPIIIDQLPQFEALNAGLRRAISNRRQVDAGVTKSNVLGWQSDTLMLRWGGDEARALARHFISLCDRFTADPRPDDPARPPFLWMPDMWANVSPRDAANNYHSHPGAVWSAVYYVDDGYAGPESVGGELVFADPRMPMTRMLPLDLRYRAPDGTAYQSEHVLRPATGRLVMFPPWLLHSVRPYLGDGERISVAMNATAYQPPALPAG
jgi:uncharacterized protein (TIGR02466 family)